MKYLHIISISALIGLLCGFEGYFHFIETIIEPIGPGFLMGLLMGSYFLHTLNKDHFFYRLIGLIFGGIATYLISIFGGLVISAFIGRSIESFFGDLSRYKEFSSFLILFFPIIIGVILSLILYLKILIKVRVIEIFNKYDFVFCILLTLLLVILFEFYDISFYRPKSFGLFNTTSIMHFLFISIVSSLILWKTKKSQQGA